MKYREIPQEFEAFELTQRNINLIADWISEEFGEKVTIQTEKRPNGNIHFITDSRLAVTAKYGDMILKRKPKVFFSLKKYVFDRLYEKVE